MDEKIIKDKIEKSLEIICQLYQNNFIEDAYIVGSVAKGTAKSGSDIDILIINPIFQKEIEFFFLQIGLEEKDPAYDKIMSEYHPIVKQIVEFLENIGIRTIIKEGVKTIFKDETAVFQTYKGELIQIWGFPDISKVKLPNIRINRKDCIIEGEDVYSDLLSTEFQNEINKCYSIVELEKDIKEIQKSKISIETKSKWLNIVNKRLIELKMEDQKDTVKIGDYANYSMRNFVELLEHTDDIDGLQNFHKLVLKSNKLTQVQKQLLSDDAKRKRRRLYPESITPQESKEIEEENKKAEMEFAKAVGEIFADEDD